MVHVIIYGREWAAFVYIRAPKRVAIVDGRPCCPPMGGHLCYAREMGAAGSAVVGRDQEVATLLDFLETPGALPAALVFEGEAGIGKTTLWRAGLEHAIAHSYRVLSCRPSGSETALSFAALGDLVEPVLDDILIELPNPQRRALVVALLLEDADGPPPDHRAIALAFLGVARALCRAGPVAIAVDDVQWLDPPSAFVLGFALRRMRDEPIAFLFAVRAGEADVLDLDRALPEERIQRLVVGPLSLGALQRLLKDRLGLVLSRPKLRRVHELSGGNPFFALELGRAFKRGAVRLEPGESLPSRLAALVDDRLEALPADTRAALLVASALSRPTIELVGRAGIGEPGERLAPALEANVIEFEDDRIRFSHPLLASGVYGATRPSERRALHRRLADAVPDPEERVRHLALAAEGPHPDVASALEEAATRAHSRGALAAAAELSLQARQLTPLDHADERHRRAIQAGGRTRSNPGTAAGPELCSRRRSRPRRRARHARWLSIGSDVSRSTRATVMLPSSGTGKRSPRRATISPCAACWKMGSRLPFSSCVRISPPRRRTREPRSTSPTGSATRQRR